MLKKILNLLVQGWQRESLIAKYKKQLDKLEKERENINKKYDGHNSTADLNNRRSELLKNEGERRRTKLDFANDIFNSKEYDYSN